MSAEISYFWKSDEYRSKAAKELRAARRAHSDRARETHRQIAMSYKALAENAAWLAGRTDPHGAWHRSPPVSDYKPSNANAQT